MRTNVGTVDRAARVVIGLALIGAALGLYGPSYTSLWGWIGVIPLATAAIGWCPAYTVVGLNTCRS